MPQIRTNLSFALLSALLALALSGCGDANSKASFDSVSGKHVPGWLPSGHATAAGADVSSCADCHGENLDGGISRVSCTTCHLGSAREVHPLLWGQYAYARHDSYVAANGTASCATASCHGQALSGVAGSGPSCATACHLGGATQKHAGNWSVGTGPALSTAAAHADFVTANGGYDPSSCANATCHGGNYRGVFLSGPSCYACHPADPTDPAPLPDKHPHRYASVWIADQGSPGFHGNYLRNVLLLDTSSCGTTLCHGTGGTGPACSTCH